MANCILFKQIAPILVLINCKPLYTESNLKGGMSLLLSLFKVLSIVQALVLSLLGSNFYRFRNWEGNTRNDLSSDQVGERNLFWRTRVLLSSVTFPTNHYVVFFIGVRKKENNDSTVLVLDIS